MNNIFIVFGAAFELQCNILKQVYKKTKHIPYDHFRSDTKKNVSFLTCNTKKNHEDLWIALLKRQKYKLVSNMQVQCAIYNI